MKSSAVFFLFLAISGFSQSAHAEPKLLEKGTAQISENSKQPWFVFELFSDVQNNQKVYTTRFSDPNGSKKVFSTEKVIFSNDGKPLVYEWNQLQTGESAVINIGKKIKFNYSSKTKNKTDEQDVSNNLFFPPLSFYFIREHFSELIHGKEFNVRMVAADRLDTFGFKFFLDHIDKRDGKSFYEINIKPTSFFVAAMVSTAVIETDETGKVLNFHGKMPVKIENSKGDFSDHDAFVKFSVFEQ